MSLLPIVRGLIERKCAERGIVGKTDSVVWLAEWPAVLRERTVTIAHGCPPDPPGGTVTMTLTRFLMDMQPQVGILVYVGQCDRCCVAFFGEHDDGTHDDWPPPAAAPPQERDPKGPRKR